MNVAVYCSAKDCIPEDYLRLGDELGRWLARNGHSLVYGGATGGLMTRVSQSYGSVPSSERGQLIGVVPTKVVMMGRKAACCDLLFEVQTMSERKQKMRDLADCFICLPGSYGTLDEMMDVISAGIVGEHHKPIYIVNYDHFYEQLRQQVERMEQLHFIPEEQHYRPVFVDSTDELFEYLVTNIKPSISL